MAGRIYTVSFAAVSCTLAQDFFGLTPADDKPIEIVGLFLTQTGVADVGDAAEEILRLEIIRGYTSIGSGGGAFTPTPVKSSGTAAAGFTARINDTTVANGGTPIIQHEDGFNVRIGYMNWWPEDTECGASQTNTTQVVRLVAAPADAITLSGTLYVRELG